MTTIQEGKVAAIWYTLTDDEGTTLDSNRKGGTPLPFLVGAGNIIPGLEEGLIGKAKDDFLTVSVPAEKAYGEPDPERYQAVPRDTLPPEVNLEVGAQLTATADANGQAQIVRIHEVKDEEVIIDFNHPLAGKTLHFEVTIVGVRDAKPEEVEHGHVHGKGGHQH
ncbi:MAG: FKBP-type peptidyl-prolyl cis-trans isomerase SlyD [Planctomycetota bacterium]|jgi:FKBP-type peptidyl-prolyl cis-trans isomerase SlyD